MPERTLESLTLEHPQLEPVSSDAAAQGIQVGRLLGAGGYGAVFEARSAKFAECVIKIAGVEFAGKEPDANGEMGPFRDAWTGSTTIFHFSLHNHE